MQGWPLPSQKPPKLLCTHQLSLMMSKRYVFTNIVNSRDSVYVYLDAVDKDTNLLSTLNIRDWINVLYNTFLSRSITQIDKGFLILLYKYGIINELLMDSSPLSDNDKEKLETAIQFHNKDNGLTTKRAKGV